MNKFNIVMSRPQKKKKVYCLLALTFISPRETEPPRLLMYSISVVAWLLSSLDASSNHLANPGRETSALLKKWLCK